MCFILGIREKFNIKIFIKVEKYMIILRDVENIIYKI